MRRIAIALALLALCSAAVLAQNAAKPSMAGQKIKLFVNNCPKYLNPAPIERNGTTYVPLRAGSTALGGEVKWSEATQTATVTYGGKTANVRADQALMVNGSLFIPLRWVSETLGCKVAWDGKTSTIHITTPATAPKPGGG